MEAGLAKHFYEAFAGAEANVWYNAPGTPQLVSEFFQDSERGRELREEAVDDRMSTCHLEQWKRVSIVEKKGGGRPQRRTQDSG